jgi:tetratricopeptide (TPR) repeat protein
MGMRKLCRRAGVPKGGVRSLSLVFLVAMSAMLFAPPARAEPPPPRGSVARDVDAAAVLLPELARILDALGDADPKNRRAAADAFVAFVKNHAGAFRAEIARDLQQVGDRATPALIFAAHDPARDVSRWASGELEVLGKKVPGDAVQTKSNDVLSDVLEAYGATHDLDALSAVLSFINSDRAQIRDAARRATLAYGDAALAKLREAFANLTDNPPPQAWSAADVARELFAKNDRFRLQEVYAMMDAGLLAEAAGKHEEAVAAFERVLARQPLFERRAEMAPAFVSLAQAKEDTDRAAAAAYYRTAARLAPDGPRAGQVASALDYLEGEDLLARGITDESLFQRAASADPGNVKAHAELARIEAERSRRALTTRRYEEWGGAIATLALGLAVFVGRRKRPRA